ncbi:NADH-quinone oxidoreductase subunit F [Clostridia bacterium]|nr:NADH-quinone oxidoreductase subunit F [Clostridia bacterium]
MSTGKWRIVIGEGSCGIASGAKKTETALRALLNEAGEKDAKAAKAAKAVKLEIAGCVGNCYLEPIVDVYRDGALMARYVHATEDKAAAIFEGVLDSAPAAQNDSGSAQNDDLISDEDAEVLSRQQRIVLRNAGVINPEKIGEYIEVGGYEALRKALTEQTPEQVIDEIKASGLRGRGGAGFPTWFKWDAARKAKGKKKYMVCNADEGDPGAFMDRSVLEGDPHTVLEGMAIGGYAIGADEGVIYVRAEYPLAIKRLTLAIEQAEKCGYLGDKIFNTGFSFHIRIKAGAGAFVCGEETALIASLEGERGMPRLKPPFPAQKGYWQLPTNINNVETFANVSFIIANGGSAFAAYGTEKSPGTKVFALAGKIRKGGLVEVPMGLPLSEIIFGIGGGIKNGKAFKAVQMGGPSGGCIPAALADTPVDYENITKTGAIVGSGGMIVMDEDTCMVDMARYFLDFTRKESCGKCNYCRIGTKRMLEILERITQGEGKDGDIELLEELAGKVKDGSMCGLGQTAPNPVLTTIRYFRNEYEDHIYKKRCTAHYCKALITFTITDACIGCTKCARNCPTGAIEGGVKKQHCIDQAKCIKCGRCEEVCGFRAVLRDEA